jgi:hypothetical protein
MQLHSFTILTMRSWKIIFALSLLAYLMQGCASTNPPVELPALAEQQRINELESAILALDENIDPDEAHLAATIAIEYPLELAQEYEITDSPLMHNFLVNIGVKPRGLCVDWTYDLLVRLQQERFHSLGLHWGIANYDSAFRIEHSTVIISARGAPLSRGIVLDPWRQSGQLFWAKTLEDPKYQWQPHAEVHALKRERKTLVQNRSEVR